MQLCSQGASGDGLSDLDRIDAQVRAGVQAVDPHGVEGAVDPHVEAVHAGRHPGVDHVGASRDA